jgi:putative DNA primase/helicase
MMRIDLVDGFPLTDSGNAERLVALHGDTLRHVSGWGKWYGFDGVRWAHDDAAAYRAAKATARATLRQATTIADDDRRKRIIGFATKSESRSSIEATVSLARHEVGVAIASDRLDADRMLLNVSNGTIDLRSGELREHRRTDMLTRLAPVAYDAQAACPTWDASLLRWMADDAELVSFLQRLVGYTLTGEIREHVLAFLFGDGANGKSTFLATLHAMLGDYASPAPRGLLFRSRGERHPTELATLFGRRFVTCSEIEEGQLFDEALTKDLTGGDPIECRRMREDFWSFAPSHKLFLAGNHKPTVRGDDEGIWRRMRLVPWSVVIPEAERDPMLVEKLRAELPGILAWAVRGCLAWQTNGLGAPAVVRDATAAYRSENDALGEFLRLHVTFEAGATIARRDLREKYESFCKDNGSEPFGAKRFAGRLRERGVAEAKVRQGGHFLDAWRGVRLMSEAEHAAAMAWGGSGGEGTCGARIPVSRVEGVTSAQTKNHSPHVPTAPTSPQDEPDSFSAYLKSEGIGEGE